MRHSNATLAAAVLAPILLSAAFAWFRTPSSVGIGDWDWYYSDAWVSAQALLERGWPPLWSIQLAGGSPLAGDPESLSQSPLLLLPLMLGPVLGVKVIVALLVGAGLVGCHRLGCRWLRDAAGALVFAFLFVFSGYFAMHFRAGHFPWAFFYLVPWVLLFADRLLFDPSPTLGAAIGFVVSLLLIFTGPMYHCLMFFLLPVAVIYWRVHRERLAADRVRTIVYLTLCTVMITMPRWSPIVDWQWRSPRQVGGRGGLPMTRMVDMLLRPVDDYKTPVDWSTSGIWEFWCYVGPVAALLAVFSFRRWRRWHSLAAACLGGAAILSWRGPWGSPFESLTAYVPILSSVRLYSRFMVLAAFSVALMAGGAVATTNEDRPGRISWLALVMVLGVAADYGMVVAPIWNRVFPESLESVYPDWGAPTEAARYTTVGSAPPFQQFTENQEMFNSRMLPLIMRGTIVSNAYVTLNLRPAWIRNGPIVDGLSEAQYSIHNHRMEFLGNFQEGERISINLRRVRYWKSEDRSAYRVQPERGHIVVDILEPCSRVVLRFERGWEIADWVVSAIGLAMLARWLARRSAHARPAEIGRVAPSP